MAEMAEGRREDTTVPCSPCTPWHRVCGLTVVGPPHASRTPPSPISLPLPIISPMSIFPCLLSPAPVFPSQSSPSLGKLPQTTSALP